MSHRLTADFSTSLRLSLRCCPLLACGDQAEQNFPGCQLESPEIGGQLSIMCFTPNVLVKLVGMLDSKQYIYVEGDRVHGNRVKMRYRDLVSRMLNRSLRIKPPRKPNISNSDRNIPSTAPQTELSAVGARISFAISSNSEWASNFNPLTSGRWEGPKNRTGEEDHIPGRSSARISTAQFTHFYLLRNAERWPVTKKAELPQYSRQREYDWQQHSSIQNRLHLFYDYII